MTATSGWRVVAELAASQHGAFHRSQAAESSISAYRLRSAVTRGELRRASSDVFAFSAALASWRQRLMVLSLGGAVVSHRAAAALHRLDGSTEGRLEVTVHPGGGGRNVGAQVTVHRSARLEPGLDVTEVDGIACTTVARTLVDLAQVLPLRRVEPALDAALRGGLSVEHVRATVDRLWRPGLTGLGPLRELLQDPSRQGALPDSLFERLVERVLLDRGIRAPVRQFEVQLESGVRRLDLAWPGYRVGVEAHSKRYHFGPSNETDDNHRDLELAAAGWEVLYVTWKMANQPDFFVGQLRKVLRRRGANGATIRG